MSHLPRSDRRPDEATSSLRNRPSVPVELVRGPDGASLAPCRPWGSLTDGAPEAWLDVRVDRQAEKECVVVLRLANIGDGPLRSARLVQSSGVVRTLLAVQGPGGVVRRGEGLAFQPLDVLAPGQVAVWRLRLRVDVVPAFRLAERDTRLHRPLSVAPVPLSA